ncbi:hypothetical protein ACHAXA_001008 [Cyclostephanos tholiformis]|uniref:Uncharacterized protein n=1 Tax=Cyclostephanos tholiformis TaxID=382380 RepID=A0ABD3SDZ5_9STRA
MEDVAEAPSYPTATDEPLPDLMSLVDSASQLPDGRVRDAALLEALRMCRGEMEHAESASRDARRRLIEVRERFDSIAMLLSGGGDDPPTTTMTSEGVNTRDDGVRRTRKRGVAPASSHDDDDPSANKRQRPSTISTVDGEMGGIFIPETIPTQIPTNPIRKPATYTFAADPSRYVMTEEDVANHREDFYKKILGVSASGVEDYAPSPTQANLRSRSQLARGIHIVRNWNTGADGLTVEAFRSMHKSWYTKMKSPNPNLGRRTGIHVRTLQPSHEGEEGEVVLCRYNKDNTRSTLYLDVTQLYDALFEIHCLECNHAGGGNALKLRVAELYANLPEGQIRAFLDTCPVCIQRRSSN